MTQVVSSTSGLLLRIVLVTGYGLSAVKQQCGIVRRAVIVDLSRHRSPSWSPSYCYSRSRSHTLTRKAVAGTVAGAVAVVARTCISFQL